MESFCEAAWVYFIIFSLTVLSNDPVILPMQLRIDVCVRRMPGGIPAFPNVEGGFSTQRQREVVWNNLSLKDSPLHSDHMDMRSRTKVNPLFPFAQEQQVYLVINSSLRKHLDQILVICSNQYTINQSSQNLCVVGEDY